MTEDHTIFDAIQAFASLRAGMAFTTEEIALFYVMLECWNAARRPAVISQWANMTCANSGLSEKHQLPNVRNGLVQKGVIHFRKNGNRGIPQYSFNALFELPEPDWLLPKNGSKPGSKCGSKRGVSAGVNADSYQGKGEEEEKESPLTPKGEWDEVFPKACFQKSKTDQKKIRVLRTNEKMAFIGQWFGRKPETLWSVAEAKALMDLNPSRDEVKDLDAYRKTPNEYHRRDLMTLLNNWHGELDRARAPKSAPVGFAEQRREIAQERSPL